MACVDNGFIVYIVGFVRLAAVPKQQFYPLPSQRAKLVESFLELVFNEKYMLVDTVKKQFR
jgi:hypothetical protein